jgi:hypothetical protein
MKYTCRHLLTPPWRRRQRIWQEVFPHARIITDPKKLAQLNAAVANRKRKEEAERNGTLTSSMRKEAVLPLQIVFHPPCGMSETAFAGVHSSAPKDKSRQR